jgi:hypothetical protein
MVNQFEIGRQNKAAKTQSLLREKTKRPTVPSAMSNALGMGSRPGAAGPQGLDMNRDAWANALQTMEGVRTPDPLTAFAKVAGMGFAGYGQGKATREKEAGSTAFKARLADALAGKPDNQTLMTLMADPYADEQSQRMAWDFYQRNNPTEDELQQRQLREVQMERDRQAMAIAQQAQEQSGQRFQNEQTTWQQQQAEIQRQNALRGGRMDAVEGFMGQHEAAGGDLFSPEMQAQLRQQGIQGVDPADTRRYDAMQPHVEAGMYDEAYQQYAAPSSGTDLEFGAPGSGIFRNGQFIGTVPKEETATNDLREYKAAVEQGYEGTFVDYQTMMKKAGATTNNIDLSGGGDKEVFNRMGTLYDSVNSMRTGLRSLREAKKAILDGAITGPMANERLFLQKIGAALGIADTQTITNTETFRSSIAPQVAAMIRATVGSTQISDGDRKFAMMAAGGDIELDQGTILRLVDIMERANAAAIDEYQDRLDRVYPPDSTDPNVQRSRAIYEVPDEAPMQGDIMRLPSDPAEANRIHATIPPGTWYQAPDGSMRIKQ